MKAHEFWTKFINLFAEGSESLKTARRHWRKSRDFTNEFVNKYIPDIIKEGNDISEFEYFRIDIISYAQRKNEADSYAYKGNLTPYLWDLKVAFEHENNSKEWLDEVIKLSHINCPLRVVVGYFTPDEPQRQEALAFAAEMLKKKVGETIQNGEFLLIIGNGDNSTTPKQLGTNTYTPYLYENGQFVKQPR